MIAKPSVAVLVFMLGACAAPVLAAPQLYLSWGAPYGEPGATSTLEAACDDSARVDTLYLSFEIDKLRPGVARMEATLTFTPLHGDTLLPFWSFQSGWPNQGNLLVDFVPFVERFCPAPWGFFGDGDVRYDHSGRARDASPSATPFRPVERRPARRVGAAAFLEWVAGADLLVPNRDEAAALTGIADRRAPRAP